MSELRLYPELVTFEPGGVYRSTDDVRLSVVVMGHVRRAERMAALVQRLRGQGIDPGRSIDAQPPLRKTTERYETSLWPNARSAWTGWHPDATHHIVIQDDVLICADFVQVMAYLAHLRPGAVISPYSEQDDILRARATGQSWVIHDRGLYGLCSMWPVEVLADAVGWIDAHFAPEFRWDDARFNVYCLAHERSVWVTAPSLVQHGCPERRESLVAHGGDDRLSRWFIGEQGYGLEMGWTHIHVPPIRVTGWGHLASEFSRQYYHLHDVPYQPATSQWFLVQDQTDDEMEWQESTMAKRVQVVRGYRGRETGFQFLPEGDYQTGGSYDLVRGIIPSALALWLVEYGYAKPLPDATTDEWVSDVAEEDVAPDGEESPQDEGEWVQPESGVAWPEGIPLSEAQKIALDEANVSWLRIMAADMLYPEGGAGEEELLAVEGIGPATVQKLRDWQIEQIASEDAEAADVADE